MTRDYYLSEIWKLNLLTVFSIVFRYSIKFKEFINSSTRIITIRYWILVSEQYTENKGHSLYLIYGF